MSGGAALIYCRLDAELLTIADVGEALSVSRWQVYQLLNAGRLPSVRINRRRLVARDDLKQFIDELRTERHHDA